MPEDRWTNDGHVLIVAPDGVSPEDGDVSIVIACPPGGCSGPFLACDKCSGSGYVMVPDVGEEPCPVCDESGWDKGVHQCWFAAGVEDWREALQDEHADWWRPGRYRMSYRTDGHFEDFHTAIRRGEPVAALDDHGTPAERQEYTPEGQPCSTCGGRKVIHTDRPGATSPRPCPACVAGHKGGPS